MKQIKISDVTMKQAAEGFSLSFKEKIELAKLLDKLGVNLIELEGIKNPRIDALSIKSIAAAVSGSGVAVPVSLEGGSVKQTWEALQHAKHPRLQVIASVSPVQMEYLFHKKPEAMLEAVRSTIAECRKLCNEVEFVAEDATRSEQAFLSKVISEAINSGAGIVTLCDTAGVMLPAEFAEFIKKQYTETPELKNVKVGVFCANILSMADASAIASVSEGVEEIKTAAYPLGSPSLENVARILDAKKESLNVFCDVRVNQLSRATDQIAWVCQEGKNKAAATVSTTDEEANISLTVHDDISAVSKAVETLGYDLSEEDNVRVYSAFKQIAEKKEKVSFKELDAIVASAAMQVPSTYKLDTYVITSGNNISATAHIKLTKNDQAVEGVYIGDGSIDAAFNAIEKITGYHYELDDFQLKAVTEGREAMGQTVVKLRSNGKLYSGRGISTDIVGAGIEAYLSALNKIIYEEEV